VTASGGPSREALVLTGPREFELADVPVPDVGPDDVLLGELRRDGPGLSRVGIGRPPVGYRSVEVVIDYDRIRVGSLPMR
jgi:hypothetical protein